MTSLHRMGGAAALTLRPATTLASLAVDSHDLVDAGEAFTRGTARGIGVVGGQLRATGGEGVFTSAPLRAPWPFTHVGLDWAASVPPNASSLPAVLPPDVEKKNVWAISPPAMTTRPPVPRTAASRFSSAAQVAPSSVRA